MSLSRLTKLYVDGLTTNSKNIHKTSKVSSATFGVNNRKGGFDLARLRPSHHKTEVVVSRTPLTKTRLFPVSRFANSVRFYSTSASDDLVVEVPPLAESIKEGRVLEWSKKEGDAVKTDDTVVSIETEKITVEVRAPVSGVIGNTFAQEGEDVNVGAKLFSIKKGAEGKSESKQPEKKSEPKQETKQQETKQQEVKQQEKKEPQQQEKKEPQQQEKKEPQKQSPPQPAKQSTEKESAPQAEKSSEPARQAQPKPTESRAAPPVEPKQRGSREEKRVRMSKMRSRIAQRLKDSQNTAAMLTTFNEVDMHNLIELRNKYKDQFQKKHQVKLGFMSAFVKAASAALAEFPIVNAFIEDDAIVYRDYHDVSVAVATPNGLLVPVIRNVENLSFADVEKTINELAIKGRDGKIAMEDMAGGTFTISNGGVYGSLCGTPIINPPQSAILGMHAINQRAHVVGNEIKIRPIMFVALTYDHRLIDGRDAVLFLRKIKECIEDPQVLLLDL